MKTNLDYTIKEQKNLIKLIELVKEREEWGINRIITGNVLRNGQCTVIIYSLKLIT